MMSKLKLLACCGHLALLLLGSVTAAPHQHVMAPALAPGPPPPCTDWPQTCPDGKSGIPRSPYKQTWMMNLSTIIMPCNNTGYTDPESTKGWGIVDCTVLSNLVGHMCFWNIPTLCRLQPVRAVTRVLT
jgi:hypothetical protein